MAHKAESEMEEAKDRGQLLPQRWLMVQKSWATKSQS